MALRENNFRNIIRKSKKISIYSSKVLGDNCIIYATLSYFDKGPLFALFKIISCHLYLETLI